LLLAIRNNSIIKNGNDVSVLVSRAKQYFILKALCLLTLCFFHKQELDSIHIFCIIDSSIDTTCTTLSYNIGTCIVGKCRFKDDLVIALNDRTKILG